LSRHAQISDTLPISPRGKRNDFNQERTLYSTMTNDYEQRTTNYQKQTQTKPMGVKVDLAGTFPD
jgi:hypothetical protein